MAATLRVLGIFPHPDDEAYSCGGTIARLAAAGAEVHILCATAGEAGEDLRSGEGSVDLGEVRRRELACACSAIGAQPPDWLDLPDGRVAEVDFPAAVAGIVSAIRSFQPHLLLSLGLDGVYGHPDHLALYRLVVAAVASSGGGERFPEQELGPSWTPLRHFAAAYPKGMFRPMYDHMLGSAYTSSIRGLDPDELGVEPHLVAAAIDIRPFAEQKLAAIRCHASQLRDGNPETLFPGDLVRRTLSVELFSLVSGQLSTGRLSDLSDGLEI